MRTRYTAPGEPKEIMFTSSENISTGDTFGTKPGPDKAVNV